MWEKRFRSPGKNPAHGQQHQQRQQGQRQRQLDQDECSDSKLWKSCLVSLQEGKEQNKDCRKMSNVQLTSEMQFQKSLNSWPINHLGLWNKGTKLKSNKIVYLEVEKSEGDVLNDFLGHVLRVELGPELELKLSLFLDVLAQNLLVQLEPGRQVLWVGVLEPEKPDLAQADRFHHLPKASIISSE